MMHVVLVCAHVHVITNACSMCFRPRVRAHVMVNACHAHVRLRLCLCFRPCLRLRQLSRRRVR